MKTVGTFGFPMLLLIFLSSSHLSAQLLQDYSQIASIRHYALDSLRIGGGVTIIDYDNDGLEDIYLGGGELPPQLYRNLGEFDFDKVTVEAGLGDITATTFGANAADLDNDGDTDLFITTGEGHSSILMRNNGDGTFTDVSEAAGLLATQYWGTSVTFADFNADNYLDIYVGNYARNPTVPLEGNSSVGAYPNELWLSSGKPLQYEEVATQKGVGGFGFTLAVYATDPDQDHDMDLLVVNDFGMVPNEGNRFYQNDGQGNFTENSEALGLDLRIFGMGASLADYDRDGDFDWYLSDIGTNPLLVQQADGTFLNQSIEQGVDGGQNVSWGATFFDSNNDARSDIFMANGSVLGEASQPQIYYENLGGQFLLTQFNRIQSPYYARGFAFSDLDNDGDLDIVASSVAEQPTDQVPLLMVLRNIADLRNSENRYLQIDLSSSNYAAGAYGTLLKLYLDDASQSIKVVSNGGAYMSGHSPIIHFGLGTRNIDSLEVYWPDGQRQVNQDVPFNTLISLHETDGWKLIRSNVVTANRESATESKLKLYPIPATDHLNIAMSRASGKIYIGIRTIEGQLLNQHLINKKLSEIIQIPLLDIPRGIYLVDIITEESKITKHIIVR